MTADRILRAIDATLTATEAPMPEPTADQLHADECAFCVAPSLRRLPNGACASCPIHGTTAAPYDAGDAAPRRHITLTPPTADEQIHNLTHELSRHVGALQDANRELDEAVGMLARIGDTISPTGERPEEALGTLVADVEAVVRQRDALEAERDDLRIQLADTTANSDRFREQLTRHAARISGLEADLRTACRDARELYVELSQTRADHAAALELLTVYSDAHERIDRARANYATRPRRHAAEPSDSAAGGTEVHDGPAGAHEGAQGGDEDAAADLRERLAALAALEEYIGESCRNASHNIRDVLAGADPRPDADRHGLGERWRALLAEHATRSAACPTCSGPVRETVGMVCQTCGTDYATREG